MILKPQPIFLICTVLTACTPYGESFDCPPGRGMGCKSLNFINLMVEQGKLPLEQEVDSENAPLESVPLEGHSLQIDRPAKQIPSKKGAYEARNVCSPQSLLSNTTHLKLWVAAYEEGPEIIHGPSMVYVDLSKPGNENSSSQSMTETP